MSKSDVSISVQSDIIVKNHVVPVCSMSDISISKLDKVNSILYLLHNATHLRSVYLF